MVMKTECEYHVIILEHSWTRKFEKIRNFEKIDNLFNPFSHMYNGFSHQARISNCSWTSELWFGNKTWKFYEVGNTVISLETKKVTFRPRSSSFTLELLKVGKITFKLEIPLPLETSLSGWKHEWCSITFNLGKSSWKRLSEQSYFEIFLHRFFKLFPIKIICFQVQIDVSN